MAHCAVAQDGGRRAPKSDISLASKFLSNSTGCAFVSPKQKGGASGYFVEMSQEPVPHDPNEAGALGYTIPETPIDREGGALVPTTPVVIQGQTRVVLSSPPAGRRAITPQNPVMNEPSVPGDGTGTAAPTTPIRKIVKGINPEVDPTAWYVADGNSQALFDLHFGCNANPSMVGPQQKRTLGTRSIFSTGKKVQPWSNAARHPSAMKPHGADSSYRPIATTEASTWVDPVTVIGTRTVI